ncbi:ImmA/IrrE family metallo-endopeptidase [Pseudonocardia sp.]|uniref:ImmA/IrrE family metallo-endopeptidase n=1 Tax=Pseudonocardia sp. TaxID=60912 RepID=UPI003D0E8A0B
MVGSDAPRCAAAADADLLTWCRRRLRTVLPELPSSLDELRRRMEEVRGRRVELAITDPGRLRLPSGLWGQVRSGTEVHDLVWVDRRTSPFARTVVACHEFGHMICGHEPDPVPPPEPVGVLAADLALAPAHVPAVVGRCGEPCSPGSREWRREREAELTGRLLAQHILATHTGA